MQTQNRLITIQGLVVPVEWDEGGRIIATAISTYLEEEYLIELDTCGQELSALLRQNVQVSGTVRQDDCGNKIITVRKYETVAI
ncbi:MAG: hypothetical protein ACLFVT_02775 [Syntrophobacteria bacterium]